MYKKMIHILIWYMTQPSKVNAPSQKAEHYMYNTNICWYIPLTCGNEPIAALLDRQGNPPEKEVLNWRPCQRNQFPSQVSIRSAKLVITKQCKQKDNENVDTHLPSYALLLYRYIKIVNLELIVSLHRTNLFYVTNKMFLKNCLPKKTTAQFHAQMQISYNSRAAVEKQIKK